MNPIKQNAIKLLELMVKSEKDDFPNSWFQDQSVLLPQDINDAIFYLQNNSAIYVLRADDTAPFRFSAVRLTSNGRYLYHEWQPHDNLVSTSLEKEKEPMDKKKVFVVHGRNEAANDALFNFLRAIGLNPIEWSQAVNLTGKTAPFIGDILEKAFSNAQAAVVLLTGDDEAKLRNELLKSNDPDYEKKLTPQARPNVLFEAGMAFGRHADRTVIIELGYLRPFSDISGRYVIKMNNSIAMRQELAQRLKTAGCDIDLIGTQWHKVGDFENAILPHQTINEKEPTQDKKDLNEEQIGILKLLAEHEDKGTYQLEASVIARQLNTPLIKINHYLELLENDEYIYGSYFYTDQPSLYGLGSKGRAFLINNKLI